MSTQLTTRRILLQSAMSVGALGALAQSITAADPVAKKIQVKDGAVILFQGDSITDAGRNIGAAEPNAEKALGYGYAMLAAGKLLRAYPQQKPLIFNRGISGHKVPDLAERWEKDTIALKPDILSILIGVNDLWHTFAFGSKYKGTVADYESGLRALLESTLKALPTVQIVLCEPFTTRTSDEFKPLAEYRAVVQKIAQEKSFLLVPFQAAFDEAIKVAPASFWAPDGIHPSPAGHDLMAEVWRKAVGI
jgi:lysophospholipase L1-like esterase